MPDPTITDTAGWAFDDGQAKCTLTHGAPARHCCARAGLAAALPHLILPLIAEADEHGDRKLPDWTLWRHTAGWLRERFGVPVDPPGPVDPPKPCPEGFHWIGQSFATCELCVLPAWEHDGMAAPAQDSPYSTGWVLKPWEPGEREAVKAKWGPRVPVDPKDGTAVTG